MIKDKPGAIKIDIRGYPPPDFTWKKDGVKIDNSTGRYHVATNGTLIISNVETGDAGTYDATGEKNLYLAKSGDIVVSVLGELTLLYDNMMFLYSQLSPCGHPAITDTPLLRTVCKIPAENTMKCIEITLALTDSRYLRHCGHFMWSPTNIFIVLLSLQRTPWTYFSACG